MLCEHSLGGTDENDQVGIISFRAEIRTVNLPNTNQKRYWDEPACSVCTDNFVQLVEAINCELNRAKCSSFVATRNIGPPYSSSSAHVNQPAGGFGVKPTPRSRP